MRKSSLSKEQRKSQGIHADDQLECISWLVSAGLAPATTAQEAALGVSENGCVRLHPKYWNHIWAWGFNFSRV